MTLTNQEDTSASGATPPETNSTTLDTTEPDSIDLPSVEDMPPVAFSDGSIPGDLVFDVKYAVCDLKTVRSIRDIGDDDLAQDRREIAVEIGARTFGKLFLLAAKKATRRVQYEVFKKEFICLDDILTNIRIGNLKSGPVVCGIKKSSYTPLLKRMGTLRMAAIDVFVRQGLELPPVPCWGRQFGTSSYFNISDFEVVAATFRAEVENFLAVLDEQFNYEAGISNSG